MSLRVRLTLFYSLFVALILAVVALLVYKLTENSLTSSLEQRAVQALDDISQGQIEEGLRRLPGDAYYDIVLYPSGIRDLSTSEDLRDGVRSYDYIDVRLYRRNPTSDDLVSLVSDQVINQVFNGEEVSTRVDLSNGQSLLVRLKRDNIYRIESRLTPFLVAVGQRTEALFIVGVPAGGVQSILNQLATNLWLTVLSAFGLFALGVWLVSSQVLSPVKRVTHAASRVTGADLSQRVPVPNTKDEMKELAVTLNRMLDRLQESFETQRRFTADASHELRTPVTAIVGHANYLLRRTKPTEEQVESLGVIRGEADRMARLVNDLLELARADAGFSIDRQPMNLVEVVESVHMEIAPVAGETQIQVSNTDPLIEVSGDATRLKQVILNLVQNALNAGAKHITISIFREKQNVRLEILDDGPGIPAEAIPHLFERFYRVDGARSTRGNGSGLGLAIVKWIVQQHDGQVQVESRVGEGTVFTVTLPLLTPKQTEVRHATPRAARPKASA